VDGTKDGGVEESIDGVEDGEMEGRTFKLIFVGLDETDGDVDGTPRLGSHGMSIIDGSKYASHKAYTLGFPSPSRPPVLKMDNLQ